jgi:membrane protease YdiL (CAAX protease family)
MAMFGADFSNARNAWRESATDAQPVSWAVAFVFLFVILQLGLPAIAQLFVAMGWSLELASKGMQQEDIMKTLTTDTAFLKAVAMATFTALIPTSILTAWLVYRAAGWHGGERQQAMALHFPDLGWLGWFTVIVGFVVMVAGVTVGIRYLSGNLESMGEVEKVVLLLSTDASAKVLIPLAIGLFGPVAEEFIFRGPIFSRLLATRLAMIGTVTVTAFLFSMMHVTYFAQGFQAGLVALLPLFFMGLVLGWLRLKFGSLWVPIVCHCVWNLLASVALFNAPMPGAS